MSFDLETLLMEFEDKDQQAIAELAGAQMDDLQLVRFTALPVGTYGFELQEATAKKVDVEDKETGIITPVLVVEIPIEVKEVQKILKLPEGKTPDDFVGRTEKQSFFLKDSDAIGRMNAFLFDCGVDFTGVTWMECLTTRIAGTKFYGACRHVPNKNNPDRPYANITPPMKKAS